MMEDLSNCVSQSLCYKGRIHETPVFHMAESITSSSDLYKKNFCYHCEIHGDCVALVNLTTKTQGGFTHRIDSVSSKSYISLLSRVKSLLCFGVCASSKEYLHLSTKELLGNKVNYWEKILRELASKVVHSFENCEPNSFFNSVLEELISWTMSAYWYICYYVSLVVKVLILVRSTCDCILSIERNSVVRVFSSNKKAYLCRRKRGVTRCFVILNTVISVIRHFVRLYYIDRDVYGLSYLTSRYVKLFKDLEVAARKIAVTEDLVPIFEKRKFSLFCDMCYYSKTYSEFVISSLIEKHIEIMLKELVKEWESDKVSTRGINGVLKNVLVLPVDQEQEETSVYYARKVSNWIHEDTCPVYTLQVGESIEETLVKIVKLANISHIDCLAEFFTKQFSSCLLHKSAYDNHHKNIAARMGHPPLEASSMVAFRNFNEEMKRPGVWEAEQGATSTADNPRDNLASLYRPPFHLMYQGPFDKTKQVAADQDKWLLVNLQSTKEFSSHMLNRDTWANEALAQTISTNFIFCKNDDTTEGRKVCTYYNLVSIPVVLVLDPITGQKMRLWSGMIQPEHLLEELLPFMDGGPKDHHVALPHKRPRETSQAPTVNPNDAHETTKEDEEILLALAASMAHMEEKTKDPVAESSDDTNEAKIEEPETSSSKQPVYPDLPEEPKVDKKLLCRVGVRLPDGRRLQRNFLRTDPIQLLWSYCSSLVEVEPRPFHLTQAIPGASKTLDYEAKLTFDESGLSNSMISVTWE
ncbi:hypothetical protein MKW92_014590 [Papaver armeniacum]|nr:hypothetical protein MKW92_014590 [Papaver armeniacum]